MLVEYRNNLEQVFDHLTYTGLEIDDDPERSELYTSASRHFNAAARYEEEGMVEKLNYELQNVRRILLELEQSKNLDKGL